MRSLFVLVTVLSFCLSGFAAEKEEDATDGNFVEALKQGKFKVALRYRYETVADDNPVFMGRDGDASTLRSTIGYTSAAYRGFRARIELEDVTDIGMADDHNNLGAGSLANAVTDRPVVADPEITEFNQATLRYEGVKKLVI